MFQQNDKSTILFFHMLRPHLPGRQPRSAPALRNEERRDEAPFPQGLQGVAAAVVLRHHAQAGGAAVHAVKLGVVGKGPFHLTSITTGLSSSPKLNNGARVGFSFASGCLSSQFNTVTACTIWAYSPWVPQVVGRKGQKPLISSVKPLRLVLKQVVPVRLLYTPFSVSGFFHTVRGRIGRRWSCCLPTQKSA